MMIASYFKYGPMRDNYEKHKCMDAIGNIEKRLEKYKETGNTEFLADLANFAMIEFMYPQKEGARYQPTDGTNLGKRTTVGISVNEMKDIKEGNGDRWLKY